MARIERYFAPDATYYDTRGTAHERQELVAHIEQLSTAIADLETSVMETLAEGPHIAFRYSITGRQVGPFQDMRPTYDHVDCECIGFLEHDGKAVREVTVVFDLLGVRHQLGGI